MQELQARVERLQRENHQLWSSVEKSLEPGNDVRNGDRAKHPVVCNKGKKHVVSDNESPADDELSSRRSPSMSPPLRRNARGNKRAKSRRKHSHYLSLSDSVSGASRRAREPTDRRQNQPSSSPSKRVNITRWHDDANAAYASLLRCRADIRCAAHSPDSGAR